MQKSNLSTRQRLNERKEKGVLQKRSACGGSSRSSLKKAILIFGDLLITQEIPKIAFVMV